jgi:ABC-2 type transport system permease protein
MQRRILNILWLGTKELHSLRRDKVVVGFLIYSFTLAIYAQATGRSSEVHNASIGIVDEDRSTLSGRIGNAFLPPNFQDPVYLASDEVAAALDHDRLMFVLDIPPKFERDVIRGNRTAVMLHIDATAMGQAGVGAAYIQSIVRDEIDRFLLRTDRDPEQTIQLIIRRAFNPNGDPVWFASLMSLVSQVTMLTIILTGAALIREREHGTIEHLLVMPLESFEIALAKVWANSLVILICVAFALYVIIAEVLEVPIAGSPWLYLLGTVVYLFFATALGIFLGTITRGMAQFAMLVILIIIALQMLSGGNTPVKSQPQWLQQITWFLPSRHYISFSQAVVYRGAGLEIVWHELIAVAVMGLTFLFAALLMFRRQVARVT